MFGRARAIGESTGSERDVAVARLLDSETGFPLGTRGATNDRCRPSNGGHTRHPPHTMVCTAARTDAADWREVDEPGSRVHPRFVSAWISLRWSSRHVVRVVLSLCGNAGSPRWRVAPMLQIGTRSVPDGNRRGRP